MDLDIGSVLHFLEHKSILLTGATGFLAKIFVEKILRLQPNIKKLYLLLRAPDSKSALQRFNNEVMSKDLFRVLKEKSGAHLNTILAEKITLVPGDISRDDDLGINESNLVQEMCSQLDAIINLAATTNFDERYDIALGLNTFGAKNVVDFAKKCVNLKILVHVSTAYVSGERSGLIMENSYKMGETLNGVSGLDIDMEKQLVEQELNHLQSQGVSEDAITIYLKDLGIQRAKKYGWPNTYVFTKAMGEMVVEKMREEISSVVIIRPTIITSTYKEPFPGWAEGIRTIDSLAVGYGKGRLTCFLGDLKAVVDVIPADMVVNAIIVAMVGHANQNDNENVVIYQVGSSSRNPVRYTNLQDYGYRYFTNKPWINKDGKPVKVGKVTVLNSMASFHRYMNLRYVLPLQGLKLANAALCKSFQHTCSDLNRKINFVMRLVDLYRPYLFFNGIYDDTNTEKLRLAAKESGVETDLFYFDPKNLDWDDYFMNTHIPGIVKYVFK